MPDYGWQAQWDRGYARQGSPAPDHRAQLAEILAQVSREALQGDGLDEVLRRIVDSVVRQLPVAIASILLLDDGGGSFVQEVRAGELAPDGIDTMPMDAMAGVAGRCVDSGKAQLIVDTRSEPGCVAGNAAVRSQYLVPIRHRERLHGVLVIESIDEDFFNPGSCTVFDAIAHQIAGAIHLARVVSELELANRKLREASMADGLTGLANRRSFSERLAADCGRLARDGGSLALLLLDTDCFKQLNDAFGHLHGDECLQRLARICTGFAESEADMVARYGGDELMLLLPGRSAAQAERIAEQLRRKIEEAAMAHPSSIVAPWLTVSIGVCAMVPENASRSPARMLAAVDRALYSAKVGGRNRVGLWDPVRHGESEPAA